MSRLIKNYVIFVLITAIKKIIFVKITRHSHFEGVKAHDIDLVKQWGSSQVFRERRLANLQLTLGIIVAD